MTEFIFRIRKQDLYAARQHAQSIDGHSGATTAQEDSSADALVVEKRKLIPRTVDVYRLKGIVGQLFGIRPLSVKLVWETEEWDPVGEGDGGWSVSEDGSDEERVERKEERREGVSWVRREMELVDGTREVGFFVEGKVARVRVEVR